MTRWRTTPSFVGLCPASEKSSRAARASSAKSDTRCELALRRELWRRGLCYRLHHPGLPGRPDIVFPRQRIVIFCDGDFWHGRDLDSRLARLGRGHNAAYWVAKVKRNVERDSRQTSALQEAGWAVLRYWETDVVRRPSEIADEILALLPARRHVGRPQVSPVSSSATSSGAGIAGPESDSNRVARAAGIHHPSIATGTSPNVTAPTS